jgi:hypothetical protein
LDEKFVSEPVDPIRGAFDTVSMATGEPGLPSRFRWQGREYVVDSVLEKWKETGQCKHKSREQYVRKHWYRVRTTDGVEMKLYFERQPRSCSTLKQRWWLYSITE